MTYHATLTNLMQEPHVFVSHSKDDPNFDFFAKAFALAGMKMDAMEFEKIYPPPFSSIREKVTDQWVRATFVLLSQKLVEKPHTMNWVAFEAGLSCARGLPVWVFEPAEQRIQFSVPYCTAQMLYLPKSKEHLDFLRNQLVVMKPIMRPMVFGIGPGWLLPFANETPGRPTVCAKDECQLSFTQVNNATHFPCPSCRTELTMQTATPTLPNLKVKPAL